MIDLLDGGRHGDGRLRRPVQVGGRGRQRPALLRRPLLASRTVRRPARAPTSPMTKYGFPTVPGLLDAARKPFKATGLGMPWYAAYGNHDGLIQGNAPLDRSLLQHLHRQHEDHRAAGRRSTRLAFAAGLLAGTPLPEGLPSRHGHGGRQAQGQQPRRRRSPRTSTPPAPRSATASPPKTAPRAPPTTRSKRPTRCVGIVLDTVNPGGLSNGSLDQTQFAWLKTQLTAAKRQDRHPLQPPHDRHDGQRHAGPGRKGPAHPRTGGARAMLLTYPQVVLWVNGHTHVNAVVPHQPYLRHGRLLGAQHRLPHRLATAEPAGRDPGQPRRHPVGLRHHPGLRGARHPTPRSSTPRLSWPRSHGCSRPTTGRNAPATAPPSTAGAARRPTATSSCWSPTHARAETSPAPCSSHPPPFARLQLRPLRPRRRSNPEGVAKARV